MFPIAEVATAFVTLAPSARGFGSSVSRAIGGDLDVAGREGGKRLTSGMGATVAASAKSIFAPLALAAAAVGVVDFFKGAISGASDLVETGNKVATVFGSGAAAVQSFAAQGARELGQTNFQALNAAATFGVFGKSAGLSGRQLATFSTDFTSLATDMASFSNTSPEEAIQAIGAALRGESEPIRQYGVLLDDATLRNEALRLGLIKSTKTALTPQQRVLAAQAAIYKQTKDAQGDFARTSGGLANQQRILTAQFTDFKTTVGAALLPVVTRLVTFLNANLIPGIQSVGRFLSPVVTAVRGFFQAGSRGQSMFAPVVAFLRDRVAPAFGGVVGAVRKFLDVALPIAQQFVDGLKAKLTPLMPTIRVIFDTIGKIVTDVMGLVKAVIERVTSVVGFIWDHWGKDILNVVTTVFTAVVNVVKPALDLLRGIIKTVTSLIKGDWSGVWDGLKQIVTAAWAVITAVVKGAISIVKSVLSAAWSVIKTGASAAWDGIKNVVSTAWVNIKKSVSTGIGNAVTLVKALPGLMVSALGNLGRLLFDAGAKLLQGLADGITSRVRAVLDTVAGIAGRIADFFPGSPVATGPLTSWNRGGAGKRLVGLLADGLSDTSAVEAAANRLASTLTLPRLTGAPAFAGAAATGSGGGGNYTLHYQGQASPAELFTAWETQQRRQAALHPVFG